MLKAGTKDASNPFIPMMQKHHLTVILKNLHGDQAVDELCTSIPSGFFGGEIQDHEEINFPPEIEASFDGEDDEVEELEPTTRTTTMFLKGCLIMWLAVK
jgi:hypothetical protein